MKIDEIMIASAEELEARSAELAESTEDMSADVLEERAAEAEAIEKRLADLKAEAEERKAQAEQIAKSNTEEVTETVEIEERKIMNNMEIRQSNEYIEAFAKYIRTGKDMECRALLTETVSGSVPVPVMVEGIIKHAWDNMPLLSKVTTTNFAGNVKIGFELSATAASIHTEGAEAPAEETLTLGIVTMVPQTMKKWIRISDEALEQNPVSLLEYVYSEIAYKIFKLAEDTIVSKILAAPQVATSTAPSVGKVTITAPALGDVVDAEALLSDEATNIYVICSKATEAAYKKLALAANYAADPFDGLTVINNDSVGANTMIVGDLKGVQANFVNGNSIQFKYDDLSEAEADLVKIVGRLPIAIEVVADKRFAKVTA